MVLTFGLRPWKSPSRSTRAQRAPKRARRRRATWKPLLELLEVRTAPSAYPIFVNTTLDEDDAVMGTLAPPAGPDMKLSLREAINYANDTPGTTINFAIPTGDLGYNATLGWWTIRLTMGELPVLMANATTTE